MNRNRTFRVAIAAAAVAFLVLPALTACGSGPAQEEITTIEGSRARLYSSLDELASDAAVLVLARVVDRSVLADGLSGSPATSVTIEVLEGFDLPASDSGPPIRTPTPGTEYQVFQYGTDTIEGLAPQLIIGDEYILFLTSTALPDAKSSEFFVTGSSAGIFQAEKDLYKNLSTDGDKLPSPITEEDLENIAG